MDIFLDTAVVGEISTGLGWGLVDGVTTNPTLIAKEKRPFRDLVDEIVQIVDGVINLEVVATDADGMVQQGRELRLADFVRGLRFVEPFLGADRVLHHALRALVRDLRVLVLRLRRRLLGAGRLQIGFRLRDLVSGQPLLKTHCGLALLHLRADAFGAERVVGALLA